MKETNSGIREQGRKKTNTRWRLSPIAHDFPISGVFLFSLGNEGLPHFVLVVNLWDQRKDRLTNDPWFTWIVLSLFDFYYNDLTQPPLNVHMSTREPPRDQVSGTSQVGDCCRRRGSRKVWRPCVCNKWWSCLVVFWTHPNELCVSIQLTRATPT